jgi:exportin-1
VTLKCFTEIGGLQVGPEYNDKFVTLFGMVMDGVGAVLPLSLNLADVYENSSDDEQNYIQNLALFLSNFLGAHLKVWKLS